MPAGWVGILSVEQHFPESRSLKDKRMHLRSLKEQLQNRGRRRDDEQDPQRRRESEERFDQDQEI